MNKTYHIKKANTDLEKEQCRGLINRAFRDRQLVARKDRDMIPIEQVRELSGKNAELYMLTDKNSGNLLGTVLLSLGQGVAEIRYLAVEPSSFGGGLGKALMEYAEDQACSIYRKKKVRVTTIYHPDETQEKLIKWYLAQGYRDVDEILMTQVDKNNWFEPQYHELISVKHFEKKLPS